CFDRAARLELLTSRLEQGVPELVGATVRDDESVFSERLVFALDLYRRRVIHGIRDRGLVAQHRRALGVFAEREAFLDRGLIAVRVIALILAIREVRGLHDERAAVPAASRVPAATRQTLLDRELAVADVHATGFVLDL